MMIVASYMMYIVYLYLLLYTIYYIITIQCLVQFIGRIGESNICTNIVYHDLQFKIHNNKS